MASDTGFQYVFLDPLIDDIDDVLAIRAAAIALYKEGKSIMKWQSEGTSAERSWTAPVESILAETRMFLKQKDPATYGYPIRNSRQWRIG